MGVIPVNNLFFLFRSGSEQQNEDSQHPGRDQQPPQGSHDHQICLNHKENHQNSQPSYPQLQWDHVASCGAKPADPSNPADAHYPRRPLRKLPSGVAPLWNNLQGNVKQLKPQTSKIFHEGGKKVNRALQGVKTSFSSLSQVNDSKTQFDFSLFVTEMSRHDGSQMFWRFLCHFI